MKFERADLKKWQENGGKIALYGAGDCGRRFYGMLEDVGIAADCFLDKSVERQREKILNKVPCLPPEQVLGNENYIVFISVGFQLFEEVYALVERAGHPHIASMSDLIEDVIRDETGVFFKWIQDVAMYPTANVFYNLPLEYGRKDRVSISFGQERIAVYTAIFGEYDDLAEPEWVGENIDYYFISDAKPQKDSKFHWIDAKTVIPDAIDTPIMRNRYVKMFPDKVFPEYKYSIYIDGNIRILEDITDFLGKSSIGISAFQHPTMDCVYWEMIDMVRTGRVGTAETIKQAKKYMDEGFPLHYGFTVMNVIAREHHHPICRKLMQEWWQEFIKEAKRDQFSFMYILWKNGFGFSDIDCIRGNVWKCSKFDLIKHIWQRKEGSEGK